jgi:hypothetical protein
MKWVIQENLYNKDGYDALLRALEINNCDYSVHKVIPFSDILIPNPQMENNRAVVFGAYTLMQIAGERGWNPGAFTNRNFDYQICINNWQDEMLNADAEILTLRNVFIHKPTFIRPIFDNKSFGGQVFESNEFMNWKLDLEQMLEVDGYSTLSLDDKVIVSSTKEIYKEYRFFIVDGEISTQSLYKQGNTVFYQNFVDAESINYVNKMLNIWQPHKCFVLDIALTNNGYKIIEINCLNGAGFYAVDVSKLIQDLNYYLNGN